MNADKGSGKHRNLFLLLRSRRSNSWITPTLQP